MKSFKFKLRPIVWILLAVVILFSLVGIGWNIYSVITYLGINTLKMVSALIIAILCVLLTVVAISMLIVNKYVVKDGEIIAYFGIIKTKVSISDVKEIVHFKKSDKLVIYSSDDNYSVLLLGKEDFDDFVITVREFNKSITFSVKIDGEDTPE